MKLMNWFAQEESGQGLVEYGLILALIAVVVIVAMTTLGKQLSGLFEKVASSIK